MAKAERLPIYNFPIGVDQKTLLSLKERAQKTGSSALAAAHWLKEEGLFLKEMGKKFFPQDWLRRLAVEEYIWVATLILETADELRVDFSSEKAALLKRDPSGLSLLTWWGNEGLKEFKSRPKEESQARLTGRLNAIRRYKEFYLALT